MNGSNTSQNTNDAVNHPSHYNNGDHECIDIMIETQGIDAVKDFCICNAFKYLYRHNGKNGVEDIRKAQWYLNKYIELEEDEPKLIINDEEFKVTVSPAVIKIDSNGGVE